MLTRPWLYLHIQVFIPKNAKEDMSSSQTFLFDMVNEVAGTTAFLKQILEDSGIVKVLHDCRQDAAALLAQRGITLTQVFDTQVTNKHSPS